VRKKIALVGAGNIGGILGMLCLSKDLGDVVLLDVNEGLAVGKSLDLCQMGCLTGGGVHIAGTSNFEQGLSGADVVVVTAGLARKPGMSRDDLLKTNAAIMKSIAHHIRDHAPNAFVVVVTNPLDAMVWVMQQESGLPPQKVVGMAGILDSARLKAFLAEEFDVSPKDINTMVLGGHGDTMVPLLNHSTVGSMTLQNLLDAGWISKDRLDEILERTRQGGAEIVKYLQAGSAFFTPAAAAIEMVESYLKDQKRILPCAAYVQGEYGIEGLYVGVPVVIGGDGIEEIIELPLTEAEHQALLKSAGAVKGLIETFKHS
jgi:malate dehydrogenase